VSRETQGYVLLLLGGAVLRAGLTDVYLRYVKAGLRPLLLAAGVVLIIAALATFWYELRRNRARRRGGDDAHDHDNGGATAHHEPRIAWLMVLPVFVLFLVVPPPLGSYAANRTGTALQVGLTVPAPPVGDPAPMSLVDYATLAVYGNGRTLGDRRVTITGFIMVGPHGAPYLARMILSCCAADAQPIKVGLSGQVPPDLRPDAWMEITGTYSTKLIKDDVNGGPIPFIQVTRTRPIPAPHDPYGT
jgi:putative membrane protein